MRSLAHNPSQAAARVVALVMLADGHVCRGEYSALERKDICTLLGLAPGSFPGVVQMLCEDLMQGGYTGGALIDAVDEPTLAALMSEVKDSQLQQLAVQLAHAAAEADNHLSEGEARVIDAARRYWQIEPAGIVAAVV